MEKHILVDISNGGVIYQVFFMLSFLVAYAILVYEGYKRKFPLLAWVLILASVQFASIIGTKVFSYSAEEWQSMFHNHILLPNTEKSLLGCTIFAAIVFIATKKLFKFRYPVWDAFSVAFPAGVSFMTVGCFFYGCCYGTVSSLPLAVQYPVMSLAHYNQFQSGIINNSNLYSLPVHPVQLYATAGGITVAVIAACFRRKWKAPGNLLIFSVVLFLFMRFTVEFFRDPLTNKFGGSMLGILKEVQWVYLVTATLLVPVLIYREIKCRDIKLPVNHTYPSLALQLGYLIAIVIVFTTLRSWFRLPEIIAINIAFLPALYYVGREMLRTFASSKYRWAFIVVLILPLFLMSQTLPQTQIDSSKAKKVRTYHTIGTGYAAGHYQDDRMTFTGSGCDMVTNHEYFNQKYTAAGASYSFTREYTDEQKVTVFGADMMFGKYSQIRLSDNQVTDLNIFGISPYFRYETKWAGIGAGFSTGNLVYTEGDSRQETFNGPPSSSYLKTMIFPRFYLRFGVKSRLYADFHIADQFPVSSPGLAFQTGLGSGFGLKNGFNVRAGLSFLERSSLYISSYIPIKDRFVIEPLFLWRGGFMTQNNSGIPEKQVSIGLSYRFDKK